MAFTDPEPVMPIYKNMDFHQSAKEFEINYDNLTEFNELHYDWRRLIEIQSSFIIKNLPEEANILEIGCGEGILLNELKKKGFSVTGVEPSKTAVIRSKKRNLNIIMGSFPGVKINESFDLVVLSQVLEHIPNLPTFICEIKKKIPSGYLLLTQTNFKGLFPSILKAQWYGWVPEQHFWHFTLEGLTKYLGKFGFKRIGYKYSSLVHPHNFLYKVASLNGSWQDQFTVLYKLEEGN
jgi:2-polyprenyl-3-methyl-5-hydroxy-6-metoxy-1,4-benzoquinol methylase